MSLLSMLYQMETSEVITVNCGGRHVRGEICESCNNERVVYIRRQDPRRVKLRRIGMTLVVLAGFVGAYLVFTS